MMSVLCVCSQVSTVLSNMVQSLIEQPSVRLLKHIVRCYLRLSENPRSVPACSTSWSQLAWLMRLIAIIMRIMVWE
jgi:uncharacterized protein YsxB (DUF464 family)